MKQRPARFAPAAMAPAIASILAIAALVAFCSGCAGATVRSRTASLLGVSAPSLDGGATFFQPSADWPRHPRHRPPAPDAPDHYVPRDEDRHHDAGGMLGVNLGRDDQPERSGGAFMAYWVINRCLDFVDMFTITVGGGPAMHAEVHVTDAFRFGLGGGLQATFGLSEAPGQGGFYKRSWFEAAVGPLQVGSIEHGSIVSSVQEIDEKYEGVRLPEDYLYQVKRDYWSVGGSAAVFFVGAQVEIHFLQMFDWFAGFALMDPLRDDI